MYYIGDEEIEALKNLFAKKRLYRYHSTGPSECDLFESEFAQVMSENQTKGAHALLLSSGTNALIAAMLAAGIQPGDEVIIPAYTFVATATAVIQVGAIPILANIDENLGLCPQDTRRKITKKTKAIIPVHMDGLAANLHELMTLAQEFQLILIEDVAQAIGGSYRGQRLGTYGLFGCYSLNENKIISCGEGGILITRDRGLYEKAFCVHDAPAQFNPTKKTFFTEIQPFLGSSMRVSEIQGTIMRVQLSRLPRILDELRVRKNIFRKHLSDCGDTLFVSGHCPSGDCASSIHLQFSDPTEGMVLGKTLRDQGLLFAPVTTRPAHASWKWNHLLGERSHIQPARNPYHLTDQTYEYLTADVLDSVSILTRTLKMDVNLALSLEETAQLALKARAVLHRA
jgi:dTDP-4-amino-4,6-dideoxygalactose transaminase